MTTKKEKKSVKKVTSAKKDKMVSKTVKASGKTGVRKPVVGKTPVAVEIDKKKMAAFFSAGGLTESKTEVKPEPVAPAQSLSVPVVSKSVAGNRPETVVEKVDPEALVVEVVAKEQNSEIQKTEDDKGEIEMATIETGESSTKSSNSGSFSMLPMFVVLLMVALFWFYYISAAPLHKAAAAQLEQGSAKISTLEATVKNLRVEIAVLQGEITGLQSSVRKVQAKFPTVTVKRVATVKPVKGSSFDKAPIPFWRTMQHPRTKYLQKIGSAKAAPVKAKKTAVKAVTGDSFSKAPVPFWRKTKTTHPAGKVEKGANHDSSFDKAPIPFWRK